MPVSSPPIDHLRQPPRYAATASLLLLLGLLASTTPARDNAHAALGPNPSRPVIAAAPGDSRTEPAPLGAEATAGPWRLRVLEVVLGPEATDLVLAAAATNEPPRAGVAYVLLNLRAENAGDRPLPLDGNDFALTGDAGLVRRFVGVQPPAPALDGTVEPGQTRDGWIVLAAPTDEGNLLLVFDSLTLPGVWADCVFALQDSAAIPDAPAPAAAPNAAGNDVTAPAAPATPVVTADWQVELLDVASGEALFTLMDYDTQALGLDDAVNETTWVGLYLRVTNTQTGGAAAFLPPNAFALVDETGEPVPDVATLTPPRPDASGAYYPGAARDGWVAFELPVGYTAATVRFLPYATDPDPRYLAYE